MLKNAYRSKPKSILYEKAKRFAVLIVELSDSLCQDRHFRLADQILRIGTSIGANVREAGRAESGLDFIHKMNIALKECEETQYWLEILVESERIDNDSFEHLTKLAKELEAMLVASINTKRQNLNTDKEHRTAR